MKKIVGIFVCMLLVATALSVAGTRNTEQADLCADVAPEKGVIPSGAGDFPILYEFPITGDNHCVGVGFDGTNFWVSAGDGTTGQCTFYLFDETGALLDSAQQGGGATGWGHRDMTWNGAHMFGSYDPLIDAFADIGTYSGNFIGPISPNRAQAFDGTYFYTCGFGEMLYRLEWDGNWGSTATATTLTGPWSGCYGLAYDEVFDCLWMTTADYTGTLYKLDMDGNLLETYTLLPEYDIQGGCTMADTSYGYVLAVLQQHDVDTITFYEVHPADEPELDIGEISGGFGITSSVKNTGTGDATDVEWSITLDGGLIILGKETTGSIATIAAAGEEEIKSGLIFGIGKPTITVFAECAEGKTAEANATGFVLLFFVLNVA
jgi:hypothetical protein